MLRVRRILARPLATAVLAAVVAAMVVLAAPPKARAVGQKPVVTKVVLFWMHEPDLFDEGVFMWAIHVNVAGMDPDGGRLKRRILVLDRSGEQRVLATDDDYDPDDPHNPPTESGGPLFGTEDGFPERIAELVGGEVMFWLEDYDGNVSDVVTLPITSNLKHNDAPSIADVSFDDVLGGKIVVSGVNMTSNLKVTINKRRVDRAAVSASADGATLVVDLAAAGLAAERGYQIRVGAGKRRSNPAFLRP